MSLYYLFKRKEQIIRINYFYCGCSVLNLSESFVKCWRSGRATRLGDNQLKMKCNRRDILKRVKHLLFLVKTYHYIIVHQINVLLMKKLELSINFTQIIKSDLPYSRYMDSWIVGITKYACQPEKNTHRSIDSYIIFQKS